MKKHQIDELFSQKLGNYSVEPSESSRLRFLKMVEARQTKKVGLMSYAKWGMAASLTVLVGWAVFWWAVGTRPQQELVIAGKSWPLETTNVPIAEPKPRKNEKIVQGKISQPKSVLLAEPMQETISEAKPTALSATGVSEVDEVIPDELTRALQDSQEKEAEELQVPSDGLFREGAGKTIIIVSSDFEKEEEIYVPSLNADSPVSMKEAEKHGEALEEQEKSLIAKVFKELRHLKHGEKVDLQKLSEGRRTATARKEDTFIGNETQELKARLNWIRERLF